MRAKYLEIAEALHTRVRAGDYVLANLPGERRIADEFGVSHMTARKAVQRLLNKGVLSRPNGGTRAARPQRAAKRELRVCFVFPAFESNNILALFKSLNNVVEKRQGVVRPVTYVHEEDPSIFEALNGDFTGTFMLPPHRPSPLLLDQMERCKTRLVTLWYNFTHMDIPCVDFGSVYGVDRLIEHLVQLGHRRIDCLNTQPHDSVSEMRINRWREVLGAKGLSGELHDKPVQPFDDARLAARDYMRDVLAGGRPSATAIICSTTGAAIGVCCACYEAGVQVGRDLSVCGFGELSSAKLYSPSITVTSPADFGTYLAKGLDWIESNGRCVLPSLHLRPDEESIWVGESTGPAPVVYSGS